MSDTHDVRGHYEAAIPDPDGLLARLTDFIDSMPGRVTVHALAGLDQFHFGGLAATAALARRVAPGLFDIATIVGARMGGMAANFARSLREGRLRLAMGVCTAV